jgi:hypothetical protein
MSDPITPAGMAAIRARYDQLFLTRLEQSSENMSRTFGCKPLIVFEWVLDSEKV